MKQMNRIKYSTQALLAVVLSAGFVGLASAGIVGSKHDLSTAGAAQGTGTGDKVCVFCHTPHGSDISAPVPLWNKILGTPGSYTQYSTLQLPTFDSAEAPVGSVSLACLSCHDGTQAMDVVINAPGPGLGTPGGGRFMTTTPVPVLGTDLTNDHPISIQYAGGGITSTNHNTAGSQFAGTVGDPDFNMPFVDIVNSNPIWWVDSTGGTAGTREKTDMILYARNEASVAGGVQPFVECGSCHDPHNDATGVDAGSVQFLRISNVSSNVCTACHIK
jgi:hypothetical protein